MNAITNLMPLAGTGIELITWGYSSFPRWHTRRREKDMRGAMKALIGIGAAALLSTTTAAQQQSAPGQKPQQGQQMMSMDDMMKGCREHCQATTKSIDQMSKMMEDAKASNDPVKMQAALDQAQKPLADMKDHMGMCMKMMNMMENMHGKGGMMKKPPEEDR